MHAAITSYFDVAQITLYLFLGFFAGVVYYLHREDKREGYPLESERTGVVVQGFPAIPHRRPFYWPMVPRLKRPANIPMILAPSKHHPLPDFLVRL